MSLQVALVANFYFRPSDEKWRLLTHFGELVSIGRSLHHGMAIDATHAPVGMRARIPVRLNAFLMALEAGLVLNFHRGWRILAECDQPAHSASAARTDVVAARPVAIFTSPFFRFVTRVEEENFPHHGLGKFLELFGVTSLANFVTDVSGGGGFWGIGRCRREPGTSNQ